MKISDIRKLDMNALTSKLKDLREEEFNLKMQVATQQLADFRKVYAVRRDVARIKTVMTEMSKVDTADKKKK